MSIGTYVPRYCRLGWRRCSRFSWSTSESGCRRWRRLNLSSWAGCDRSLPPASERMTTNHFGPDGREPNAKHSPNDATITSLNLSGGWSGICDRQW